MAEQNELLIRVDEIRASYHEFISSVEAVDEQSKDHSKGFLGRLFGNYVSNPRNSLCDQFFSKVKGQIEPLASAVEQAELEIQTQVSEALAELMLQPRPAKSNQAQDLMYRAMVSQFMPFVPYLSAQSLEHYAQQLRTAYRSIDLLPVEKTLLQALDKETKNRY